MVVKICGITNREDALVAIENGATALGFNFYPKSPRYIALHEAARLIATLPSGVWKVGVFVNEAPENVVKVAVQVGLDVAQLHGRTDIPVCVDLLKKNTGKNACATWQALPVDANFRLEQLEAYHVEAFLLDAPSGELHGGTGKTFDWARVAASDKKIVLAGGLDADNVRRAIEQARPWGVDACSRLESSPGHKDHTKVARFLKMVVGSSS